MNEDFKNKLKELYSEHMEDFDDYLNLKFLYLYLLCLDEPIYSSNKVMIYEYYEKLLEEIRSSFKEML